MVIHSKLENIAKGAFGFKVELFDPSEKSHHILGFVRCGEKLIAINSSLDKLERRFILAHEIGHLQHGGCYKDYIDYKDEYKKLANPIANKEESDANQYAYDVLMPVEKFIKKYVQTNGNNQRLSKSFGVSIERIGKRIDYLSEKNIL